jgi:tetratricopeptide (TPR) repeat protein
MAVMLCDQGRYDEAIVLEEQILAYNRNTHPGGHLNIGVALTNLAISYRQIHRYQDALAIFEQALQLDPEYMIARREREIVLRNLIKMTQRMPS